MQGLPSGSYLVEVANPTFTYEPARVEVTSKGKTRARKVNNVQPTAIAHLAYPLKFKTLGKTKYFAMVCDFKTLLLEKSVKNSIYLKPRLTWLEQYIYRIYSNIYSNYRFIITVCKTYEIYTFTCLISRTSKTTFNNDQPRSGKEKDL